MARRGSGAGIGVIVVLGVAGFLLQTAYDFVIANAVEIGTLLGVTGVIFLAASALKRKTVPGASNTDPLTATAVASRRTETDIPQYRRHQGSAPAIVKRSTTRWIAPGDVVRIQGSDISGGLFYLGSELATPSGPTSQYVVNPDLNAAGRTPDIAGNTMYYWPSYDTMSPAARLAFLTWMAEGRRNPEFGSGHPLLFFFGLEHRLFIDDGDDASAVISEVAKLLASYPESSTFKDKAEKFIVFASVKAGVPLPTPVLHPEPASAFYVDMAVRLHLGRKLIHTPHLDADDALLWVLNMPEVAPRMPAVRCFDELKALWRLKYAKRYPKGIEVKHESNIQLSYKAASGAFEVPITGEHEAYPDIAKATGWKALSNMLESCTLDLEGLSRFLARKPEKRDSMQAVLLLPPVLQGDPELKALRQFHNAITELHNGAATAATTMRKILDAGGFDIPNHGRLSAHIVDQLGSALDMINVAVEPDRRYGGGIPALDDQVYIFSAVRGGPVEATKPAFMLARSEIEVVVLAAAADGDASADELESIVRRIGAKQDLTGIEKARLIAFADMLFKNPPKQSRVLKRLADRPVEERQTIADAAVNMIGNDTTIETREVRFLENLHKSLGLPQESVYSSLHGLEAAKQLEPPAPSATPAVSAAADITLPEQPGFDAKRLAKTKRDTAAVSRLLADIFSEEADAPPPPPPISTRLVGLDDDLAQLVERLLPVGKMPRAEFEHCARELQLMPDGAIEKINDWAFDTFEEALLDEEGDHIIVAPMVGDRVVEQLKVAA